MSGGLFDYKQNYITNIADEIEDYINCPYRQCEPQIVLDRMVEAIKVLREAYVMAQRVDWLLSGDDGNESFIRRWDEDLKNVRDRNKRL